MGNSVAGETRTALRDLVVRYSLAVDQRDAPALLALFHPDAVLTTPAGRLEGEQIGRIPHMLTAKYPKTYHFLGQSHFELSTQQATGESYCVANHLTVEEDRASNYVMHIRYRDAYRPDENGVWKINHRQVLVDWTETKEADAGSW